MWWQRNERKLLLAALVAAAFGLVAGWRLMWFLTDDAFIAFRYISNSMLGHGYVWNAAPFAPVEGYTSFLWVMLLDGVWRLTGVQPPAAANVVSLLCSLLTLGLGAMMAWRLDWTTRLRPHRILLVCLLLAGLVSSRVFLTWSSSGLETALFNLLVLAWLFCLLRLGRGARLEVSGLTGAVALLTLTRPDGLLYLAATVAVLVWQWWRTGFRLSWIRLAATWPLLLVVVHLLWRRSFYGSWLPNTYHAKTAAAWPEAGWRYLASFVLEHALWLWAGLVLWGLAAAWQQRRSGLSALLGREVVLPTVAVLTLAAHVGYYTLVVGGDHFEYRILSHLTVPVLLALLWAVNRAGRGLTSASLLVTAVLVLAAILPWSHWFLSQPYQTRENTHQLRIRLSDSAPAAALWYTRPLDDLQDWLIGHYVCSRHQEHKIAAKVWLNEVVPPREEGERVGLNRPYPVMAFWGGIGGLAWSLPHVNFIDLFGLSDRVIARSEAVDRSQRRMAHDRIAPEDYVNAFQPNVQLAPGRQVKIGRRPHPLTAEQIRQIEARWLNKVER